MSRASKVAAEQAAAQLLLQQQAVAPKDLDAPSLVHEAILDAYRKSQHKEKETRGVQSAAAVTSQLLLSARSNVSAVVGAHASAPAAVGTAAGGGGGGTRRVSFHTASSAQNARTDARLGFIGEDSNNIDDDGSSALMSAHAAPIIQPHQYPKLFSHSGFSPAAEEVFYQSHQQQLNLSNNNNNNNNNNKQSGKMKRTRSASPPSSSSGRPASADKASFFLSSSDQQDAQRAADDKKAASRKSELRDPIFTNSTLCADAGFLQPLSERCLHLRSSNTTVSERSAPPSIVKGRMDEVDYHALVTVGACLPSAASNSIASVVRALVEPYKGQTWKLTHLEATLCRVRAIYRWVTAFVKLDAPPTPQLLAVSLTGAAALSSATGTKHHYSQHGQAASALANRDEARANKQAGKKKVAIVAAPAGKPGDGGLGGLAALQLSGLLGVGDEKAAQQVTVPASFPYKYVDCDDPEDASYMKSELISALETLPPSLVVTNLHSIIGGKPLHELQRQQYVQEREQLLLQQQQKGDKESAAALLAHHFPASGSYVIGEETANVVFASRVGDCHQVSTLFSYMLRHSEARILPQYADATDFQNSLGVPDTPADAMHAASSRKTVAGPTGRAAAKCEAAPTPCAARAREKAEKATTGGGSSPCEVTTVRGTLKGVTGENGKPAGYLAWSWTMVSMPDGKRYLVDVPMSMAQITERFLLSMGALGAVMEEKRRIAYLTAVQQLTGIVGLLVKEAQQQQQQQQQIPQSGAGATKKAAGGGGGGGGLKSTTAQLREQLQQQQQTNPNEAALQMAASATPQPLLIQSANCGPAVFLSSSDAERIASAVVAKPVVASTDAASAFPTFSNYLDAPLALNAPMLDAHTAAMHVQWVHAGSGLGAGTAGGAGANSSGEATSSNKPSAAGTSRHEKPGTAAGADGTALSAANPNTNSSSSVISAAPPAPVMPPQQQLLSAIPSSLLLRSFIPFFFMTNPLEFACSHFPRLPQHMLITSVACVAESGPQLSRGVVKPPFTQGAWESYPRLSHRFLELGMRLRSRARRSIFVIPGPPEYLSIEAPRCPERIETKAFLFKCSSYALSAMSAVAPAMPPLVVPLSSGSQLGGGAAASSGLQRGAGAGRGGGAGGGGLSNDGSGGAPSAGGGASSAQQEAQTAAIQLRQQTVVPSSSSASASSSCATLSSTERHFTHWIQEQQQHLAKFWSHLGPGGARLATTPFSGLPRTWTAASYQRSTGTFTHTLAMPDVGVYTVVIGMREINPSTGRPVEPYFTPAVQYQVACSFAPAPEPPVAIQREATLCKVIRPLVSKLPAVAPLSQALSGGSLQFFNHTSSTVLSGGGRSPGGIPFVVAPLFPRVRGIAVINAVEKKKKKKENTRLSVLSVAGITTSAVPALPAIGGAAGAAKAAAPNAKMSKQEQAAAAKEAALQQEHERAAAAAAAASVIERVDVHLLQWDPAAAAFCGDVPLEPGQVSIWAIVENIPGDSTNATSFSSSSASASAAAATALTQSQKTRGANRSAAGAAGGQQQQQQQQPHHHHSDHDTTAATGRDSPASADDDACSSAGGSVDALLQSLQHATGRAPPRGALALHLSLATIQQTVPDPQVALQIYEQQRQQQLQSQPSVFSRFNPLCLPQGLDARGMEQMLMAVVPPPADVGGAALSSTKQTLNSASTDSRGGGTGTAQQQRSPARRKSVAGAKRGKNDAPAVDPAAAAAPPPPNRNLNEFITELAVAHKHNTIPSGSSADDPQLVSLPVAHQQHQQHHQQQQQQAGKKDHSHDATSSAAALLHQQPSGDLIQQQQQLQQQSSAAASLGVFAVPLWTDIGVQAKVLAKDVVQITNGAGFGAALGVSESVLSQMMSAYASSANIGMTKTLSSSFRSTSGSDAFNTTKSSSANLLAALSMPTGAISGGGAAATATGAFGEQVCSLVYPVRMDHEERTAVNLALCGNPQQRALKKHSAEVGDHFLHRKIK